MRRLIVTTALLLAGTSLLMAQANPPGGNTQNENAGKTLNDPDHPGPLTAPPEVGGGRFPAGISPHRSADPSGQQSEKNNEEIGKPPQGGQR